MDLKNQTEEQSEREYSAGGIIYKKTDQGIFVAMMLDPFDKWTFPKGHIDPGEEAKDTAKRETTEELGISEELVFVAPLGEVELRFRDRYVKIGKLIHKTVQFFLFEVPEGTVFKPQKEEKIQKVEWISLDSLAEQASYKNIVPIIECAQEVLRKKYEINN